MLKADIRRIRFKIFRQHGLANLRAYLAENPALPSLREAVDDPCMFVAGEAEADEPLAVKQARRLLQQRHPPSVVRDQVIVGRKDTDDHLLHATRWNVQRNALND